MERFDAPDLTLAEAKDLRSRLAALLDQEAPQETPTGGGSVLRRPAPFERTKEWDHTLRLGAFSPCGVC
jgi:hypothetical protein